MPVTRLNARHALATESLVALFAACGLGLEWVAEGADIPGSYWGAPEAGLIGAQIFTRADTPLHSILHEASHYFCMDAVRRVGLNTDAGGDELEESAVCFLSILLAAQIVTFDQATMLRDMDTWGYSFRLGSAAAWFAEDAQDARDWLIAHGVIDSELRFCGMRA